MSKLEFAVKKYVKSQNSPKQIADLKSEFTIMKMLRHPHIARAYEAFNDNGQCYLVSEYCSGGDLFDRIISRVPFTERETQILMGQIMDALYYMHTVGVVHRDIKPENILFLNKLKNFKIKITDFGVSKLFSTTYNANPEFHSFVASKYYVAPEILEENPCYTNVIDCWAVGVIVYIILVGYAPFDGKTSVDVYKKIRKKPVVYYTKEWKKYSKECLEFTKSLLTKNPKERMTSKLAVKHSWINGENLHTFYFKDTSGTCSLVTPNTGLSMNKSSKDSSQPGNMFKPSMQSN